MHNLVEHLKKRLNQQLPGEVAHNLMVPKIDGANRIRFKQNSNPRKGAVMILLYEADGLIKFPLIQRPHYDGVHSGQMALPGGKHENEDDSLEFTALRETHEEIGIAPNSIEIIGRLSEFMVSASNHLVLPVVGYANMLPAFEPDPFEVDEIIEATIDELLNPGNIKTTQIATTGGYTLQSPYFDLQGKVVWGATAMMLSEFVTILKEL